MVMQGAFTLIKNMYNWTLSETYVIRCFLLEYIGSEQTLHAHSYRQDVIAFFSSLF